MKNGTKLLARPVDVLFNVVILRGTSLWIYMRGLNDGFRPHEFVERLGAGELELTLSKNKKWEEFSTYTHHLPVSAGGFWKWSTPIDLPSGDRCNPVVVNRGWGDGIMKGFVN